MSLPVMHSAAGYGVYRLSKRNPEPHDSAVLFISIVLANLPDVDFLPGILCGKASLFHRGATHSITAGFLAAFLASGLVWLWKRKDLIGNFFIFWAAYLTHLVLDVWTSGSKGVYVFWPLINRPFYSPFADPSLPPSHPLDQALGFHSFMNAVFSSTCLDELTQELFIVFAGWAFLTAAGLHGTKTREHIPEVFSRCAAALIFFVAAIAVRHL